MDEFDTSGNLIARVAQHGQLNAPWGLALAPADFGRFSGDLLVGNFGDGQINAYELGRNGSGRIAASSGENGRSISIDGLWALEFGQRCERGPKNDALLHRRAGRRVARPLREDRGGVRGSCAQQAGDGALTGPSLAVRTRLRVAGKPKGEL